MNDTLNTKLHALHSDGRRAHRRTGVDTIFRHGHRICPVTGKLRYRDSHQASQALENTRRRRAEAEMHDGESRRHEIRSYRCESCGGFHLTSGQRDGDHTRSVDTHLATVPTGGARRRRIRAMKTIAAAAVS